MLPRHEPLFEPINLGKLHLANRVALAPTYVSMADERGRVTDQGLVSGQADVLLRASGSNHRDLRQFNRLFGIRHRVTADACADHQKYGVQATPAFGIRHPFPHSHTRDCVMEWVQDGAVTCSRLPSATRFRSDTLEGVDPVIDPGRSPGLRAGFLQSAFPGDRPSDICLR